MNKVQQQLIDARNNYVAQHGVEPNFADVLVKFKGVDEAENQTIRILNESEKNVETDSFFDDDEIFFYTEGFEGLIELCDPNNLEDFVVVDYNDLFDEL